MSKCKYDRLRTTISGTVIDAGSKKPIPGVQVFVVDSSKLKTYDAVTSGTEGSYAYTFTPPSETGNYTLQIVVPKNYICNYPSRTINAGFDKKEDIYLQKMVDMNLHLINNSGYPSSVNADNVVSACCYSPFNPLSLNKIGTKKVDTTFHVKIPNYSVITVTSRFYYNSGPYDWVTYHFNSGAKDTTVTVINP